MDFNEAQTAFIEFVKVIKALRTPGTGCPWDLEQTHETLRQYLIEEAHEVLEAIDSGDDAAFCDELGDLLLQVVLHAQVADDRGAFSITEVARGVSEKMVRRHPHVFGTAEVKSSDEVLRNWERIKAAEKPGDERGHAASLSRVPRSLPALLRAQRLGEKAAKVHFDWQSTPAVLAKVKEELKELEAELPTEESAAPFTNKTIAPEQRKRLEHELGDLLFSICQLARWLGLSAEDALRLSADRFLSRFSEMERAAPQPLSELSPDELEAQWEKAKRATNKDGASES